MSDPFREIRVVHRTPSSERAWLVDIDPSAQILDLLPELLETLHIQGEAKDFDVHTEGTIAEPVLVLEPRHRRLVGGHRSAD